MDSARRQGALYIGYCGIVLQSRIAQPPPKAVFHQHRHHKSCTVQDVEHRFVAVFDSEHHPPLEGTNHSLQHSTAKFYDSKNRFPRIYEASATSV